MQQLPLSVQQTKSDTPAFGAWLKRLRKASDLTQDDLAAQIGYAGATIRKIEAGERRPSREIAERLAHERGARQEAKSHFFDALKIAATTQTRPIALEALTGGAAVLADAGAAEKALELLAHIEQHPATWARTRERAARMAAALAAGMEVGPAEAARQRGETETLEAAIGSLLGI